MKPLFGRFMMTPAEGERMTLRLALDPNLEGVSGGLYDRRGRRMRPRAEVEAPSMGERLWDVSDRLCGERFPKG